MADRVTDTRFVSVFRRVVGDGSSLVWHSCMAYDGGRCFFPSSPLRYWCQDHGKLLDLQVARHVSIVSSMPTLHRRYRAIEPTRRDEHARLERADATALNESTARLNPFPTPSMCVAKMRNLSYSSRPSLLISAAFAAIRS